jgi:hypothetical protein
MMKFILSGKKSVVTLVTEYGVGSHSKCDEPSKDFNIRDFTPLLPNPMK